MKRLSNTKFALTYMMVRYMRLLIVLLSLVIAFSTAGTAQTKTILVILLAPTFTGHSVNVKIFNPQAGNQAVGQGNARGGVIVFPNFPVISEMEAWVQVAGQSPKRVELKGDPATPWTGPVVLRIRTSGRRGFTPASFPTLNPALRAREVTETLQAIDLFARDSDTVEDRDMFYWMLHSLRITHPEAIEEINTVEQGLRSNPDTSAAFSAPGSEERYGSIKELVAASHGRPSTITQEQLQSLVLDEDTFINVRDVALRVMGDKELPLNAVWSIVEKNATDENSPLLYSANYASAHSSKPEQQALVLQGIRSGGTARYLAAVEAAAQAELPGADPAIYSRANYGTLTLSDPMVLATTDYLIRSDAQLTSATWNTLNKLLDKSNPAVKIAISDRIRQRELLMPGSLERSLMPSHTEPVQAMQSPP